MNERFDVIVVGGGPNGLTCAAYLARAGASVVALEKRFEWGGTMTTDDYSTPYQYNLCQFALPVDRMPPYVDFHLGDQGAALLEPDPAAAFVPADGGEPLVVRRDGSGLSKELWQMLEDASSAVMPLLYAPPRPVDEVEKQLEGGKAKSAVALAQLTPSQVSSIAGDPRAAALARYFCGLTGFFTRDEPLGLIGAFCLARLFHPTIALGGTASLARGVLRAGAKARAQYRNVADVRRLEIRRGESRVMCADGREYVGKVVVSTLDPKTTFLELIEKDAVPKNIRETATRWRTDPAGPFVAHFGIKGEPPTLATEDSSAALIQVIGFKDEAEVEGHLQAVTGGKLPAAPAGHLTVTTRHDPRQASPGPYGPMHTLRYETPAPAAHPEGAWDRRRAAGYRSRCWDFITGHVNGLDRVRLRFSFADTPHDLERRFRTTRNGSVRQGALVREQTFTYRPHPECSSTRTPIDGLYLAGGGVHPGVPGSLGGGYVAAAVVASDLGLERWWSEPSTVQEARRANLLPMS